MTEPYGCGATLTFKAGDVTITVVFRRQGQASVAGQHLKSSLPPPARLKSKMDHDLAFSELANGTLYRFDDWPNPAVPPNRAGVYTIWRDDQFIYVGIGGKGIPLKKEEGIRRRLNNHASGYRGGDQFCIYVSDRLVLPKLTPEQIEAIANGQASLDIFTRIFIRGLLSYRFFLTEDGKTAFDLEKTIKLQGLKGQLPLLNPYRGQAPLIF
jgi:hypothetical protein